jgi:transmembrane sensor
MEKLYEKYKQYTVSEFAADDAFIAWIKSPNSDHSRFWNGFMETHPQQANAIEEAKKLVGLLQAARETVPDAVKDRIWMTVKNASAHKTIRLNKIWWAAAAVIVLAGSIVLWQLNKGAANAIVQTQFGEKKTITLPDASKVVLNAATHLQYKKKWTADMPREVWIDGEAYFEVVHKNKPGALIQPAERFIVHLRNMDVEVLGTTFTINTRRNEEQVVLQTGSIKVKLKNKNEEVYLKPGEMLRYTAKQQQVQPEATNAADHSLWKDNEIKFNNTSLREIARLIEDNYGYTVAITDTTLLERTFAGTLSSENEDILFKALEDMLDVKIEISHKTVTISNK